MTEMNDTNEAPSDRLALYRPKLEELRFREKLLGDEATMSYNAAWGGVIVFPESRWAEWYESWIVPDESKRFYRYLTDRLTGEFVGEIAYHFDEERAVTTANVIVLAEYRGRGYGTEALGLLCGAAREHDVRVLYDDIAIDNPAITMFLKAGFTEEYRTDMIIMLKKELGD